MGRIPGSTSALQFRIPHSAFRIEWLSRAEHTLGGRAESTSPSESAAPCSPLPLTWHMSCDTEKDEAAVPCGRDSQRLSALSDYPHRSVAQLTQLETRAARSPLRRQRHSC